MSLLENEPLLDLTITTTGESVPDHLRAYFWEFGSPIAPVTAKEVARELLPFALAMKMEEVIAGSRSWQSVVSAFKIAGTDSRKPYTPCEDHSVDQFVFNHPLIDSELDLDSEDYAKELHRHQVNVARARSICSACPIAKFCAIEGVRLKMADNERVREEILHDLIEHETEKKDEDETFRRTHINTLRQRASAQSNYSYFTFQGVFGGYDFNDRDEIAQELYALLERYHQGMQSIELGLSPNRASWLGMRPDEIQEWNSKAKKVVREAALFF